MYDNELRHYGVKGMKWKNHIYKINEKARTKRRAIKGYAQDEYNSNRTAIGRGFDTLTGNHKLRARLRYEESSKNSNEKRARQYERDRQIRKQAIKGYAQDAYNSNKTVIGKAYDTLTGNHKLRAQLKYDQSSKKANENRAEQYSKDKNSKISEKQSYKETVKKNQKQIQKGANYLDKAWNKLTGSDKIQAELKAYEDKYGR